MSPFPIIGLLGDIFLFLIQNFNRNSEDSDQTPQNLVSDLRLHCLMGGIANMAVPQSGRYDFVYLFSYTVVFILMIALLCTGDSITCKSEEQQLEANLGRGLSHSYFFFLFLSGRSHDITKMLLTWILNLCAVCLCPIKSWVYVD